MRITTRSRWTLLAALPLALAAACGDNGQLLGERVSTAGSGGSPSAGSSGSSPSSGGSTGSAAAGHGGSMTGGASGSGSGAGGASGSSSGAAGANVGDAGAGGSGDTGGVVGSTGGAAGATSYPCVGGVVTAAGGASAGSGPGGASGNGGADEAVSCVVGQSYCHVESLQKVPGALPVHTCEPLTGGLAACADSPTCACICAQGVNCHTECACNDDAGSVTVSCMQI